MKKLSLFIGSILLYAPLLLGKSIGFLELAKALEENSPKLLQAKLQTKLAQTELTSVQASYYPNLSFVATSQYSYKFKDSTTPTSVGDTYLTQSTQYQSSTSFNLNYELFRFGATLKNEQAAKAKIASSKLNECLSKISFLQDLVTSYQQARILQIRLHYLALIQKEYEELYIASKRLFSAGSLFASEVSEYALSLADSIAKINELKKEQLTSLANIYYLTGVKVEDSYLTPFLIDQPLEVREYEKSLSAKKLKLQIKEKEALLEAQKRDYLPTLSLYAKYDAYGSDLNGYSQSMDDLQQNGYRVGLALTWNLFDGFKREANMKKRLLELQNAKAQYQEDKRVYEKEQMLLNDTFKKQEKEFESLSTTKENAKNTLEINERLYKSEQIDKLTELKSSITYYQNLLKQKTSKEELIMTQMKQLVKEEEESKCVVR